MFRVNTLKNCAYLNLFNSPGQSPGRAIVLPPASTLASGAMLKFYVKVYKSSYFPNPLMDFVHIWHDDRY